MEYDRRTALGAGIGAGLTVAAGWPGRLRAAGNSLGTIRENMIGLSIFVLRTHDALALSEWYAGVLRLPMVRGQDVIYSHWVGDVHLLELLAIETETPSERLNDPDSAPTVPVFRVTDMDALVARLTRAQVQIVRRARSTLGEELFILDPDHNLLGFRQRNAESQAPWDREARRQKREGETFNPGVGMMPPDIQGIGWVVRRVADVATCERFYGTDLGFTPLGHERGRPLFDLGANVVLELAPGGTVEPRPASRKQVPAVPVVRVESHAALNGWLKSHNVVLTDDTIQYATTDLSYALDPENHMIGFDQRLAPEKFRKPRRPYREELEIARRRSLLHKDLRP